MAHTIRDKAKLQARVRRIQGQAAALEKQLAEEGDCTAILQQIAAASSDAALTAAREEKP